MVAQWIGDCIGIMHIHHISNTRLAQEMGITREYLSMLLNGHREPPGTEQRIRAAIDRLLQTDDHQ